MRSQDLTGKKYGKLTVLGRGEDYVSPSGSRLLRWKCQCECGNVINATTSQLKRGISSCGCTSRRESLIGLQFGKLTVISEAEDYVSPKGLHMAKWHCRCDCGSEIDVLGMSLKNGDTKSCGCSNYKINRPSKDYSGQQFGELSVIRKIEGSKPTKYICQCSCGREVEVLQKYLTSGRKFHCGCKTIRKHPVYVNRPQPKNYVGQVIGQLTILEELEPHITPNGSKQRIVRCRCSCGNEFDVRLSNALKSQKCRQCLVKERRTDITGQRFGKLVVLSMDTDYISPSGHRLSRCLCKCDCGNTVTVNMASLVTGRTSSCGCIQNTSGLLKDNKELVEKYDFEKNREAGIEFETLTARSSAKVWWKCKECGNSWFATIASQNDTIKHGCPYCSGRLVIKGKTDLMSQKPEIVNEWDFEKNTITPDEISCYSGIKVWWKCAEGHSWKATVSNRVNGSGCPQCNIENVNSFCEQAVYYYIKKAFPDAVNGDMHINMELDIYIPSIKTAIEYDGEAWHKSVKKQETDIAKNEKCKESGISMIRIREPRLDPITGCVSFVRRDSISSKSLDEVISSLLRYLHISDIDVDTDRDGGQILSQYATKKYENSLQYCYPEIAAEWHPTKNGALTPDKVSKAARRKVWWHGRCGHDWVMAVSDRTRPPYEDQNGKIHNPQGCPYCSSKRVLAGFNDLESQYPDIAAEWHPTKNGTLHPSDIMPGSGKKVWWLGKCGHEWQSTPNKRCKDNSQCPICYKERRSPSVVCVETGQIFKNGESAAKYVGLAKPSSIYRCCRGEQEKAKGYHWSYYSKE